MKIAAIDIETTGLDPAIDQILEFVAVLEDTNVPVVDLQELPIFRAIIVNPLNKYILSPETAQMHQRLMPYLILGQRMFSQDWDNDKLELETDTGVLELNMLDGDIIYSKPKGINHKSAGWYYIRDDRFTDIDDPNKESNWALPRAFEMFLDEHDAMGTLNVAGKNFGFFDSDFLCDKPSRNGKMFGNVEIHRRQLDPAMLYLRPEDTEMPNLITCMERAGVAPLRNHSALDDAFMVIILLREAQRQGKLFR